MNAAQKFDQRLIDGAHAYAASDKSDPFALNRALAHIRAGICRTTIDGKPSGYNAEQTTETRHLDNGMQFSNGDTEYRATVYRNVTRP